MGCLDEFEWRGWFMDENYRPSPANALELARQGAADCDTWAMNAAAKRRRERTTATRRAYFKELGPGGGSWTDWATVLGLPSVPFFWMAHSFKGRGNGPTASTAGSLRQGLLSYGWISEMLRISISIVMSLEAKEGHRRGNSARGRQTKRPLRCVSMAAAVSSGIRPSKNS